MEDAHIIGLYWARDEGAIPASDEKYGGLCRALSRNILGSSEDAEECVNDTWHRAWNAMPPQKPQCLRAFFAAITRNLSLNRWHSGRAEKRGGGLGPLLSELEDCLPDRRSPDEELEAGETAALISAFLRRQSEADRALFVRRYFPLEPLDSLARQFGMSMGQVKSKLHRMRGRLRLELEREGVTV